jgi:hypothetical protein
MFAGVGRLAGEIRSPATVATGQENQASIAPPDEFLEGQEFSER